MGKIHKGVVLALSLWMVLGGATVSWAHGLGARPGTPDEQAYVDAIYTEVREVKPNTLARARAEQEGRFSSAAVAGPAAGRACRAGDRRERGAHGAPGE